MLLVALFASVALAGCTNNDDSTVIAWFNNETSADFSTEHRFAVAPGTTVVTIDWRWDGGPAFDFALRDGVRSIQAGWADLPGNSSVDRFIAPIAGGRTGTWELDIDCPYGCEYEFAFRHEPVIQLHGSFQDRYPDATFRVAHASTGEHEAAQTVNIPANVTRLEVRASYQSAGDMDIDILDPSGDWFGGGGGNFGVVVEDFRHVHMNPQRGAYSVDIDCETECEYVVGFYAS